MPGPKHLTSVSDATIGPTRTYHEHLNTRMTGFHDYREREPGNGFNPDTRLTTLHQAILKASSNDVS
jgi:hypothetical protein